MGYHIPFCKVELADCQNVERLARFLKLNIEGLTRQELNNLVYNECKPSQKSEKQRQEYEKMWEKL